MNDNDALAVRLAEIVAAAEAAGLAGEALVDAVFSDPLLEEYVELGMAYGTPLDGETIQTIRLLEHCRIGWNR